MHSLRRKHSFLLKFMASENVYKGDSFVWVLFFFFLHKMAFFFLTIHHTPESYESLLFLTPHIVASRTL